MEMGRVCVCESARVRVRVIYHIYMMYTNIIKVYNVHFTGAINIMNCEIPGSHGEYKDDNLTGIKRRAVS